MFKRITSILMIMTMALGMFNVISDNYIDETKEGYVVQTNTIQVNSDDDDPYAG